MKNIVFLVSGGGATMKFIHYALEKSNLDVRICGIIADRDVGINHFAESEKIYFTKIKYNRNYNIDLIAELNKLNPDLIVTNIHKIIDTETLDLFRGKFINLHYSLLPAFSGFIGMKTVEEAMKQNVQFIGGTCHEVNEQVDAGRILFQGVFPVQKWENEKLSLQIDTVFKLSCLLLLSGLFSKLNICLGCMNSSEINNKLVFFSPGLPILPFEFYSEIFTKL